MKCQLLLLIGKNNMINRNNKWFTLIELIVSVTIISIMMLSIFTIYTNIITTNKKLELQRTLQENTKNIIEWLASEIRNNWIDFSKYNSSYEELNYSWSWNTILSIKNWRNYCLMKTPVWCDRTCYVNPNKCYLWSVWNANLTLSDENVEIWNLRFFISWKWTDEITTKDKQWKVTIVFDIKVAKWIWADPNLVESTKMHIQTTISEMYYKK